jgi:hypothetical protein
MKLSREKDRRVDKAPRASFCGAELDCLVVVRVAWCAN